jgi:hypothetical protein
VTVRTRRDKTKRDLAVRQDRHGGFAVQAGLAGQGEAAITIAADPAVVLAGMPAAETRWTAALPRAILQALLTMEISEGD